MKLCLSVTGKTFVEQNSMISMVNADLFELRLDRLSDVHDIEKLVKATDRPVIATNRPVTEGGLFVGPEEQRIRILLDAIEAGAQFVDIEFSTRPQVRNTVKREAQRHDCQVIFSRHLFSGTPSKDELQQLMQVMAQSKPSIIKIISTAITPTDCLRILSLYEDSVSESPELIAFAMGTAGRMSRVAALVLGAPFMYVSHTVAQEAAPGQITLDKMRTIMGALNI